MTSVAARSPVCGSKRSRLDLELDDDWQPSAHIKRFRQFGSGPPASHHFARASAHARLTSLFPTMNDQVISGVLTECDGDLEAAISRLNLLTLANGGSRDASTPTGPGTPETSPSPAEVDAELEKWSQAMCEEMAAATDVSDARARAKRLLIRLKTHIEARQREHDEAGMEQMAKENALLKRAVAIQHARMTAAADKDQQISQLQSVLGQYQERVRALELSNYSLSLHLKQATGCHNAAMDGGPPDIF